MELSLNPIPQGKYRPAVRYGNFVYTAGMTPRKDGKLIFSGKIRAGVPVEEYRPAVIQSTLNALNAIKCRLLEHETIDRILTLTVYVNAEAEYSSHAKIGDIASEYLFSQYGENGIGARVTIGVATLPGDAPVEIQIVAVIGK